MVYLNPANEWAEDDEIETPKPEPKVMNEIHQPVMPAIGPDDSGIHQEFWLIDEFDASELEDDLTLFNHPSA